MEATIPRARRARSMSFSCLGGAHGQGATTAADDEVPMIEPFNTNVSVVVPLNDSTNELKVPISSPNNRKMPSESFTTTEKETVAAEDDITLKANNVCFLNLPTESLSLDGDVGTNRESSTTSSSDSTLLRSMRAMEECGQCSATCVDMTAALLSSTSYQSVESWSTVRKEHFVFLHLLAMYKSGECSAMCVYANAKLLLTGANRPAQLLGADNDAQAQNDDDDDDDDDDEAVSPACMLMEHAIVERLLTLMVTGERSMDFVLFAAKLLFDDEAGLIHNILIHPGTTPDNFIKSLDPGYFHE